MDVISLLMIIFLWLLIGMYIGIKISEKLNKNLIEAYKEYVVCSDKVIADMRDIIKINELRELH